MPVDAPCIGGVCGEKTSRPVSLCRKLDSGQDPARPSFAGDAIAVRTMFISAHTQEIRFHGSPIGCQPPSPAVTSTLRLGDGRRDVSHALITPAQLARRRFHRAAAKRVRLDHAEISSALSIRFILFG